MAQTDPCPLKIGDAAERKFYHGRCMKAKTTSVMHPGRFFLGIAALFSVLAAEEAPLSRTVDLDIGETQELKLSDGTTAKVKLVGLSETRDSVRDAVRRAEV